MESEKQVVLENKNEPKPKIIENRKENIEEDENDDVQFIATSRDFPTMNDWYEWLKQN